MPGREVAYVGKNVIIEYRGSLRGFRECAMGPELAVSCMRVVTGRAMPYAIEISPVDQGEYKRSWRARPSFWHNAEAGPSEIRNRVAALLINVAPHSALVEWGGKPGGARRHLAQHICAKVVNHLHDSGAVDPDLAG
jgi:hypothetical protein